MAKKRIIIVEDERDMADLVAMHLKREHYDVDVAYDGAEGLRLIRATQPDLVLLDLMLPGMSGTDVLREVRGDPRIAPIPVVVLTARSGEGDIVGGLHLGADDYVTKPFSMSVLSARIAAVLRRSGAVDGPRQSLLTVGPLRINLDTYRAELDGEAVPLTLTEFRLLAAIVSAKGRVLTRDQLVNHGIGYDAVVTDRTIDVHITSLRKKLRDARKYVQTVRGVGYRLAAEEHEEA